MSRPMNDRLFAMGREAFRWANSSARVVADADGGPWYGRRRSPSTSVRRPDAPGPVGRLSPDAGKNSAISRAADSGESEPWRRSRSCSVAEVAADRAGRGLRGVGRALIVRQAVMASRPSTTAATSGPDVMNVHESAKNGLLLVLRVVRLGRARGRACAAPGPPG